MRTAETIYLDHQATTRIDARVMEEMLPYFGESFGNPHSNDHVVGWRASKVLDGAADKVAQMIGADPDEIVFTSGATEANNLALLGLCKRAVSGPRKRILASEIEHKCVLEVCKVLETQLDYKIEYLPVDAYGLLDFEALEDLISEDVLIVSVMAVNNEIGTIQDLARISGIARSAGAIFHCDAAQAPCAMDMKNFGDHVDLLSLSAHKMYGPQGIGALYVRRELTNTLEPLIYGGGQQGALRSGTVPLALCVGMGAASRLISSQRDAESRQRVGLWRDKFVNALLTSEWLISVNGIEGKRRHPGNANLCFHGYDAQDMLGALQPRLAASTGSACTTGIPETSHVLTTIGLSEEDARASIRFSLGFETTEADIDEAVELVKGALRIQKREII